MRHSMRQSSLNLGLVFVYTAVLLNLVRLVRVDLDLVSRVSCMSHDTAVVVVVGLGRQRAGLSDQRLIICPLAVPARALVRVLLLQDRFRLRV